MVQKKSSKVKEIFIYMAGGAHWIGGIQYTRNILRAVDLLPPNEQPEIILRIGPKNVNAGFEEEFGRYQYVRIDTPIEERNGFIFKLHNLRRKIKNKLSIKEDSKKIWLSDNCTVAFPVKVPNFPGPYEKVYWIPDFQYKRFPHLFSDDDRQKRDLMYAKMLQKEAILVLSSDSVKADFCRYFPEYNHIRVRVMRFSSLFTDDEYNIEPGTIAARYDLPDKFAYLPNQFFSHKRHDTVFNAIAKLKKEGLIIPIVCTGSSYDYRTSEYYQSLLTIIEENSLNDQIKLLGVIPRKEQIQIYRQATLIIQPSMSEGWSTTVEDAKSLGKEIILSDIDVHMEQAPDYGHFFTTGDIDSLAKQLRNVWPKCRLGIDIDREQNSRIRSIERGIRFARVFCKIMQEAHDMYSAGPTRQAAGHL
jgi:glycosyltransferase involved in cell wall biosynthesis